MAAMPYNIDLCDTAREKMMLKVRITRHREFFVRVWVVTVLLRAIEWVSPMPVEVEMVGPHAR